MVVDNEAERGTEDRMRREEQRSALGRSANAMTSNNEGKCVIIRLVYTDPWILGQCGGLGCFAHAMSVDNVPEWGTEERGRCKRSRGDGRRGRRQSAFPVPRRPAEHIHDPTREFLPIPVTPE